MSLGDVLLGVLDHGGAPLAAAALTYGVVRARDSAGEVRSDDRVAAELNEDLARWMRDRDRELTTEHAIITAQYNDPDSVPEWRERVPEELRHLSAGSQFYSGAHVNAHAEAQRRALHEYRDEASRKQRALDAQLEREGWLHRRRRRRRSDPLPQLALSAGDRAILDKWRLPAQVPGMDLEIPVDDPTRLELEPRLAALEGH